MWYGAVRCVVLLTGITRKVRTKFNSIEEAVSFARVRTNTSNIDKRTMTQRPDDNKI